MSIKNKEMLTKKAIKELGWTDKLINKYLPEPELKTNPIYKCAAPMQLWEKDVVEKASQTEEFKADMAKVERRRIGADKAIETKVDKLNRHIEAKIEEISVTRIPMDTLKEETLSNQEAYYRYRYNDYSYFSVWNDLAIARWEVNYIRHNLTDYDYELYNIKGKVGSRDAYAKYKVAVLNAISNVYPELIDECERQIENVLHPKEYDYYCAS